jgi:DNA-binding MarR family transcriptional regulator
MKKIISRSVLPRVGEGKRGATGHIAYLLRQAQASVRLAVDAGLMQVGLTSPQFLVLNLLDAYPGASGADLARLATLTPQTVNLIVRKLEQNKLIARHEHETHGRVLTLALTPTGSAKLKVCKGIAAKTEAQMLDLLDKNAEAIVRKWLSDVSVALTK